MRVAAVDAAGRVLLVRHRAPSGAVSWALPSCRPEPGESSGAALERLLGALEVTAGPERPGRRRTADVPCSGELVRHDEELYLVMAEGERPARDGELLCPLPDLPLLPGRGGPPAPAGPPAAAATARTVAPPAGQGGTGSPATTRTGRHPVSPPGAAAP